MTIIIAKDHMYNWIAVDDNNIIHHTIGNGNDQSVGTSTTPGPYYEEILPSYYNQVSNENLKRNQLQEDLELQENTAYQIKG